MHNQKIMLQLIPMYIHAVPCSDTFHTDLLHAVEHDLASPYVMDSVPTPCKLFS